MNDGVEIGRADGKGGNGESVRVEEVGDGSWSRMN